MSVQIPHESDMESISIDFRKSKSAQADKCSRMAIKLNSFGSHPSNAPRKDTEEMLQVMSQKLKAKEDTCTRLAYVLKYDSMQILCAALGMITLAATLGLILHIIEYPLYEVKLRDMQLLEERIHNITTKYNMTASEV